MTIVILLIAAVVLMATMLFLTIGVNELEKKSLELSGLIKKRYTLRNVPKKNKGAEAAAPAKPGAPGSPGTPGKP